jgi:hypothetical protein
MVAHLIKRESHFCSYLFQWVHTIMEYIGVANKLRVLGMQEIEKERDKHLNT